MNKYRIYAPLAEELNEGWVWIYDDELNKRIDASRRIVCIRNPHRGKPVYCEALYLDQDYVNYYKHTWGKRHVGRDTDIGTEHNRVVMNKWYRKRLGSIRPGEEQELTIKITKGPWAKFKACIQHPQVVVRLATWLGVIGVALGVITPNVVALKDVLKLVIGWIKGAV